MPDFEVWDVVKVPFPHTNRPVQQRRPAAVIAVHEAPMAPRILWVLMVTSAANRGWPGDIAISDLKMSGLPVPSLVRTAKIATIEALDAEFIGRLPAIDCSLVSAALRLGLAKALDGLGIPKPRPTSFFAQS